MWELSLSFAVSSSNALVSLRSLSMNRNNNRLGALPQICQTIQHDAQTVYSLQTVQIYAFWHNFCVLFLSPSSERKWSWGLPCTLQQKRARTGWPGKFCPRLYCKHMCTSYELYMNFIIWVTYELHIFVDSASWIISCAGAVRGSDSAGDIDLSLLVGEGSCAMSPRTSCAAASLFCITIWESRLILAYPCLSYFVLFYHGCQKRESPQGFLWQIHMPLDCARDFIEERFPNKADILWTHRKFCHENG